MACGSALFFQYLPTLLITEYGVTKHDALQASMWGTFAYAVSMPLWGRISDTLGWARTLGIGAIAMLAAGAGFFHLLPSTVAAHGNLGLMFVMPGVAVASVSALTPGLLSSLFPTNVRQSGYAFPYNIGMAVFAGLAPLTLAWLVREYGPGVPLYPVVVAAFVTAYLGLKVRTMRLYLGNMQPQSQPLPSSGKAG
jgi:MFS family permease